MPPLVELMSTRSNRGVARNKKEGLQRYGETVFPTAPGNLYGPGGSDVSRNGDDLSPGAGTAVWIDAEFGPSHRACGGAS